MNTSRPPAPRTLPARLVVWLMTAFALAAAVIGLWSLMPSTSASSGPSDSQLQQQAELGPLQEAIVVSEDDGEDRSGEPTELAGASIAAYER